MPREFPAGEQQWLFKRNCALAPRELLLAYGVLCLMSFAVSTAFALQGYWYIPLFSMLEMSAVALAMLHHARHVLDYELIALIDGVLVIEQVVAGQMQQTRLELCSTHIVPPQTTGDLIKLQTSRGTVAVSVEVGRHATLARRRQVAQELRQQPP